MRQITCSTEGCPEVNFSTHNGFLESGWTDSDRPGFGHHYECRTCAERRQITTISLPAADEKVPA